MPRDAVLILACLAEERAHGYAIRKAVAERTANEVRLGSTTLYRRLGQLLDDGLIAEDSHRPSPVLDDERRRYFRITPAGRRALREELGRLERVLVAARAVTGRRSR
jgi:DNA-binding PadR family transcriptional regulator